jgi:hypothetical protein
MFVNFLNGYFKMQKRFSELSEFSKLVAIDHFQQRNELHFNQQYNDFEDFLYKIGFSQVRATHKLNGIVKGASFDYIGLDFKRMCAAITNEKYTKLLNDFLFMNKLLIKQILKEHDNFVFSSEKSPLANFEATFDSRRTVYFVNGYRGQNIKLYIDKLERLSKNLTQFCGELSKAFFGELCEEQGKFADKEYLSKILEENFLFTEEGEYHV